MRINAQKSWACILPARAASRKNAARAGGLRQIGRSTVMTSVASTAATWAFVVLLGAGTAFGQSAHDQHHPQQAPAGQGMPMQPGMMGQMGHGMMGQGMGPGMMDHGMGSGMMHGLRVVPMMHLSPDDVRAFLEHHIAAHDLQHINVGDVAQTDADTITADLVTKNGSLALRLAVDPHTGAVKNIE
jgi:hypothetical protein